MKFHTVTGRVFVMKPGGDRCTSTTRPSEFDFDNSTSDLVIHFIRYNANLLIVSMKRIPDVRKASM